MSPMPVMDRVLEATIGPVARWIDSRWARRFERLLLHELAAQRTAFLTDWFPNIPTLLVVGSSSTNPVSDWAAGFTPVGLRPG